MPLPQVVVITASVPYTGIPHAGGQYVLALTSLLEGECDLTVLAPNIPTNRDALSRSGAPSKTLLVGGVPGRSLPGRVRARALAVLDRRLRSLDTTLPPIDLAATLLGGGPATDALRAADVVDLQWSEQVRLLPVVRRISPGARVVGTFHDVRSQQLGRRPAGTAARRWWRSALVHRARRMERRAVRGLDETLVFSAKDAGLLDGSRHVTVIHPPFARAADARRAPSEDPTVTVVAFWAREDNDVAGRWLVAEVWPRVRHAVPGARLRLVGAGVSPGLRAAVEGAGGAELAGFVPDLRAEYAGARCCVIPLRSGAGVKFKTVEALVHAVPVVSTTIGAEGIGDASWYAGISDDAQGIADAVVGVLTDPEPYEARAAAVAARVAEDYSPVRFRAVVWSAFGW